MNSPRFLFIFFAATTASFAAWLFATLWAGQAFEAGARIPGPAILLGEIFGAPLWPLAEHAPWLFAPIEWCCSKNGAVLFIVLGNAAIWGIATASLARWIARRRAIL